MSLPTSSFRLNGLAVCLSTTLALVDIIDLFYLSYLKKEWWILINYNEYFLLALFSWQMTISWWRSNLSLTSLLSWHQVNALCLEAQVDILCLGHSGICSVDQWVRIMINLNRAPALAWSVRRRVVWIGMLPSWLVLVEVSHRVRIRSWIQNRSSIYLGCRRWDHMNLGH